MKHTTGFESKRGQSHRPTKPLPRPKPDLSYYTNPPKSELARAFWRWHIRTEASFAITVLEPWEKVVVLSVLAILFTLIAISLVKFLPRQLITMQRHAVYYIWGHEAEAGGVDKLWPSLLNSTDSA
ncbi:hypothetical protein BDN71DRAFT_1419161 [Pleurotus eryngii]|uniref:Uncharacterized protein n=1 Tax=Pleurotus eryngii TaxID=5323 RepID=A0A9P5ZWM8_PLEER|nr:hypothetical protein BDN71DRAFT_1419161 [Pleurotus eryngii]